MNAIHRRVSAAGFRLALLSAVMLSFGTACVTIELPFGGGGPLSETTVYGTEGPKIAMVDITGPIAMSGQSGVLGFGGAEGMPARVRQELEIAAEDPEVAALLLRIDSPGGTVIASEVLYDEVQRFRETTGRPVIAQMMGTAASGGYYVAMAASEVRAYPSTITGSIGVIFMDLNLSGLFEKVGVSDETITSGPFKDAGSPFRPVRPEEREQLGSVIDDMYQQFVDVVDRGRPGLDRDRVRELADGRIYSARQAKAHGLIDAIGDLDAAVESARMAAGVSGPVRVVVYHRGGPPPENLFSAATPSPTLPQADGFSALLPAPGFFYLWNPGVGPPRP